MQIVDLQPFRDGKRQPFGLRSDARGCAESNPVGKTFDIPEENAFGITFGARSDDTNRRFAKVRRRLALPKAPHEAQQSFLFIL